MAGFISIPRFFRHAPRPKVAKNIGVSPRAAASSGKHMGPAITPWQLLHLAVIHIKQLVHLAVIHNNQKELGILQIKKNKYHDIWFSNGVWMQYTQISNYVSCINMSV